MNLPAFPILVSVGLHLILVAVLAFGWESTAVPKKQVAPNYVEARLVKLETSAPKQQRAKPQKVIDVAAQRREKERREAEARKQQQKLAQEKAAREKAAKDKAAKDKAAAEKAKRDRELKEKQAQEERRRRREAELFEAVEEEDEFLSDKLSAEAAQSYMAAIQNRVEMNWSRPPSARNGMSCTLRIQLVPTGRVIDVKVIKSSGNPAFDRSAEAAVRKAERFPELQGMDPQHFERNFRQFNLKFEPQDLRQ
ncbi:cell envelope integrity protein TolA [Simiduia aestuariiviva]|uniref:Colicin import membrane protein n=1 Tax=Simiduia aestuariiviva TaxID=1510459 RepID=A0A839UQT0_9GAMM|nr:colicin import membrane protein [Simiduia aestuariiviva]